MWEREQNIEEGFLQKRRHRWSLLFGGQNLFNSLPRQLFCTRTIWRIRLIHPFLHIILVQFFFFSYSILVQLILFFISSWCKIAGAARNWINSVPQTAATTFSFSSVFILLLWYVDKVVLTLRPSGKMRWPKSTVNFLHQTEIHFTLLTCSMVGMFTRRHGENKTRYSSHYVASMKHSCSIAHA